MIGFLIRLIKFIYWKYIDIKSSYKKGKKFDLYGLRVFCGRQGSGKTIGIVYMLEKYRLLYPKAKIVTNFDYINENEPFLHWRQLMDEKFLNGEDGIIVAWDEIQNDFSSTDFKDIPDYFLYTITQQRKQKICILASAQVYTRMLKALREQAFMIGVCKTFAKRWTRIKFYDSAAYSEYAERNDPKLKMKLKAISKVSFIQNNKIRELFDTYKLIKTMNQKNYVSSSFLGLNKN